MGQDEDLAFAMDNAEDYLSETDYFGTLLSNADLELSPGGTSLMEGEDLCDFFESVDQNDYENVFTNLEPVPTVISSTDRVLTEYIPEYHEAEPMPSPSSSVTSIESVCTSTTRLTRKGTPRKPKMYESDLPSDDPKQEKRIINAMKAKKNRDEKKRKEQEMTRKCEMLRRINKRTVVVLKGMSEKIKQNKIDNRDLMLRNRRKDGEIRKLKTMLFNVRTQIEVVATLSDPESRVTKALSNMLNAIPECSMDQDENTDLNYEIDEDLTWVQSRELPTVI